MNLADRLEACHSSVVHDVMKDMGLPIRVLPRTILGLDPGMKGSRAGVSRSAAGLTRPSTSIPPCSSGPGCCPSLLQAM